MAWDANLTNLKDVLADLYPFKEDSIRVVRDAGIRVATVRFNDRATTNWSEILDQADKINKVQSIIEVALQEDPNNPLLLSAQRHTLTPTKPLVSNDFTWSSTKATEILEKIIGKQSTLLPISWLEVGLQRSRPVVKVSLIDGTYGSGFIVRNNYLLTTHHVIETIEAARTATIQFNYQEHVSGRSYEPVSVALDPDAGFRTSESNDWTLVMVREEVNGDWGAIDLAPVSVEVNGRANIIQHPGGQAKQISCYHNIIAYMDKTRIQYLTDTLPGSSGSPVFDSNWQLIAVHRSGGSLIEPGTKKIVYRNEGVNINCILQNLKDLGF